MDKYLVFTFRDGTLYKLPVEVAARHFCRMHEVHTCSDADALAHWPLLPFAEIKDDLTKISHGAGLKPVQFLADATAQILTTKQIEDKLFTKTP